MAANRGNIWVLLALPISLLAVACVSDEAPTHDPDPNAPFGTLDCSQEERAMTFESGMEVFGNAGYVAEMMVATPMPMPAMRDDNAWTLQVRDSDDNAALGLAIVVAPWMPDHGHGTSVSAVVTDNGDGSYDISPVCPHVDSWPQLPGAVLHARLLRSDVV